MEQARFILRENPKVEPQKAIMSLQWFMFLAINNTNIFQLPQQSGDGTGTWGVFDGYLEEKVKVFQNMQGLKADGIVGPKTMEALWLAKNKRFGMVEEEKKDRRVNFMLKMPCDLITKGADSMMMRADVAYFYEQLYKEVKSLGGAVTSAGSLRSLSAEVSTGRIPTSMHYPALAFDMATTDAMDKPETDLYVVEMGADGYWKVYMRCNITRSTNPSYFSKMLSGKEITISNPVTQSRRGKNDGGKQRTGNKPVTGLFVNLTEIMKRFGFMPVKPHSKFFNGGSYMTAEWWHFQQEFLLMPEWSSLQQELLSIYKQSTIDANASPQLQTALKSKLLYFKQNWF